MPFPDIRLTVRQRRKLEEHAARCDPALWFCSTSSATGRVVLECDRCEEEIVVLIEAERKIDG